MPCEQTDPGAPHPFRQEAAVGLDPPVRTDGPPRSAAFNEPLRSTAATATQSSQITHARAHAADYELIFVHCVLTSIHFYLIINSKPPSRRSGGGLETLWRQLGSTLDGISTVNIIPVKINTQRTLSACVKTVSHDSLRSIWDSSRQMSLGRNHLSGKGGNPIPTDH